MNKKIITSIPKKVLNIMPKSKILKNGVARFNGFYYYKVNTQWIRGYKA